MKGKHAIILLTLLASTSCQPEKTKTHTDVPQDTVPVFVDTTGVIARVEQMYLQNFEHQNQNIPLYSTDTCFSLRLKEVWDCLPENDIIYDANIWTNLQDFDHLVYRGATLEQVVADTAWLTIRYQAFRDDTRTARIRAVREWQEGKRNWFIDDITFLQPEPSYSISDIAAYHLPDSSMWFHWSCGPHNAHEDNVIRLCFWYDQLVDGYFWGTSDEFYEGREGFEPGYIVLRMHQLSLQNDTLSFFLDSRGIQYLERPASLDAYSTEKALKLGAQPWELDHYGGFYDSIQYRAVLRADTLILLKDKSLCPYREDHFFRRCTAEEAQQLQQNSFNWAQNQIPALPSDSLSEDSLE